MSLRQTVDPDQHLPITKNLFVRQPKLTERSTAPKQNKANLFEPLICWRDLYILGLFTLDEPNEPSDNSRSVTILRHRPLRPMPTNQPTTNKRKLKDSLSPDDFQVRIFEKVYKSQFLR